MTDRPHNPCATCGACCRSYIVPVCGQDIWQISQSQHLSPEHFLVPVPQPKPRSDGFRLEPGGWTYALMLDKQGRLKVNQSCVFLVHLVGGHDRCGIYDDRPVVCQAYPMVLAPRGVSLRDRPLCPPDAWSEDEFLKRSWRRSVMRVTMQFDLYAEVVARWNARVDRARSDRMFALDEYLSYLVNVYDRVAVLDAEVGEPTMTRIELTWGYVPDPATSKFRIEDLPWPDYFSSFRDVVDEFYPEVPVDSRTPFGSAPSPHAAVEWR